MINIHIHVYIVKETGKIMNKIIILFKEINEKRERKRVSDLNDDISAIFLRNNWQNKLHGNLWIQCMVFTRNI